MFEANRENMDFKSFCQSLQYFQAEINGECISIGLNRPQKRNALNQPLILELEDILDRILPDIKCAILYGQGSHFSAGLDLSDLKDSTLHEGILHSRMWHRVMDKIQFGNIPIIAVLHGAVIGGGLELASACHIRIAEPNTYYALPEGQRGIFVGGGASLRIPKLIGLARMTDMILTGRIFNAEEGSQIGFAQYLVPQKKGLEKAMELAEKISKNNPMTNFAILQALPRIADSSRESGSLMESLMAAIAQNAPEAKSKLIEFLEGRSEKTRQK